ncbi:hypothetical protein BDV97DRAFT_410806 [Delphinella strobiligena]|nr:hypothetical protein BDV97DRAFT_410806 [Delphinella strobiligena]
MPLLTLRLLRLRSSAERFAQLLFKEPVRPTKNDVPSLAGVDYDLMLLLRTENESIPSSLRSIIQQEYKIIVGIPSKLLSAYPQRNRKLLEQAPYAKLTGSLDNPHVPESSQNLELSPNLLRFMKQKFVDVAARRGGDAKIVGNVVQPSPAVLDHEHTTVAGTDTWQEIAIVHYASIVHFCDMLADRDDQAINARFRLLALADTLLLCTTEIDLNEIRTKAAL